MTGHQTFNELTKKFSAKRRARVAERVVKLKTKMASSRLNGRRTAKEKR